MVQYRFCQKTGNQFQKEFIAQAGIVREQIKTAIAGITGIDWQDDEEKVTEELKKILEISDLHAYNDAVIALYCVEEGEGDMVLCAGTGMNAAVCDGEEYAGRMAEYIYVGLERVPRQKKKITAVLAGSVFKGEENLLTSQVIRQVKVKKENVDVILADCDPVIGACRMGRERKNGKEADNK